MKKLIKHMVVVFAVISLLLLYAMPISAETPYVSYNYDSNGEIIETVDLYNVSMVITGESLKIGDFSAPSDFYVTNNVMFLLDSGNNRIVKCDLSDLTAESITLSDNGNDISLTKDAGIYVNEEGTIFVTDSKNFCIWVAEKNGNIARKITKPNSQYFDDSLEFLPKRIIGDSVGNIYVQCTGIYEGLAIFNNEYDFSGFFGSEKVEATGDLLENYFWKQFMTKEQRESMANYVPTEIYSMDMSNDNFLYTITPGKLVGNYKHSSDTIRRLNPKGTDVIENSMTKDVEISFNNDNRYLNFIDIAYSDSGFINVLDNKQGRIYQFDENMQLVTAFAGLGNFQGTFKEPRAIEVNGDDILVLDTLKNNITFFKTTNTGATVHEALMLYNSGDYTKSMEPWLKVAEENPGFCLAYVGIGNALFNEGEYEQAMNYYELAKDTEGWSNAFKEHRIIAMRENVLWFVFIIIVVAIVLKLVSLLTKKGKIPTLKQLSNNKIGIMWYSVFHPLDGFYKIKTHKRFSYLFIVIVYLFLVLQGVAEQQYMGKAFSMADSSEVNVLSIAGVRAAILLLFVISNWAISVLLDGKATFKQICIFSSISLVPYILSGFIRVIMSHFLTDDESVFMTLVVVVGIACSFILLMVAFSEFHEFEFGKSILIFIFTIIGMALIVILAFLIYNLVQNVGEFIKTIFSELIFRINN